MIAMPALAHHLLPTTLPLPHVARTWLAATFALIGLAAWMSCLDSFSRKGHGTPLPADAPSQLVTTGLFRQIRNPLMAAELLVIWGEALYLASVGAIVYAVAISIGAHLAVVHVEEPELRRRFGERYEAYLRSVPRWLPRVGHQR